MNSVHKKLQHGTKDEKKYIEKKYKPKLPNFCLSSFHLATFDI